MTVVHHAYLIKGFLLAKEAPKAILESIDAIIERLAGTELTISTSFLPELSMPVLAESAVPAESGGPASDTCEPVAAQPASGTESMPEGPTKKKRNVSPGARAAAAERMRAMQARKKAEREAATANAAPSYSEPELRITVPKPRRKSRLTDADWPEIKEMLDAGRSRVSIANDYDEETEDLDAFISEQQCREPDSPGEALASPSSGASGAARPKW